jgi:hypothetical protein
MTSIRFLTVSLMVAALTLSAPHALAREPHPVRPFHKHFAEQDEERGKAIPAQIEKNGVAIPGPNEAFKHAGAEFPVLHLARAQRAYGGSIVSDGLDRSVHWAGKGTQQHPLARSRHFHLPCPVALEFGSHHDHRRSFNEWYAGW